MDVSLYSAIGNGATKGKLFLTNTVIDKTACKYMPTFGNERFIVHPPLVFAIELTVQQPPLGAIGDSRLRRIGF